LIGRRVGRLRISVAHGEVGGTSHVVDLEHLCPGLPAIGRLVHATLAAGPEERSLGGHDYDVVVRRIDEDASDVFRVAKTHVREGFAAVAGLPDAVTPRGSLAIGR